MDRLGLRQPDFLTIYQFVSPDTIFVISAGFQSLIRVCRLCAVLDGRNRFEFISVILCVTLCAVEYIAVRTGDLFPA